MNGAARAARQLKLRVYSPAKPRSKRGGQAACPGAAQAAGPASLGFTLIEIMVAVGMMAVFMSIAIPTLYRNMNQDSMRKAVSDVMEACSVARARAILDNAPMELRIRPVERSFMVGPAAQQNTDLGGIQPRVDYQFGDRMVAHPSPASAGSGFSVTLSHSIIIEGLGVNGEDWTEDQEARIRFYPNGTCDEMSIVLFSDKGERRNIWLEVVTGFAELEVDPFKFRAR
jgi:prepilin-type N-terminal cleavage/methylation domain-containing protein